MNHKEVYLSGGNIVLLSIEWNTFDYNNFHSSMNHKEVYLSGGNILYCLSNETHSIIITFISL